MHNKRDAYARGGVLEYVVVAVKSRKVYWFDLSRNAEIEPIEGVFHSNVFPGLVLDANALFGKDIAGMLAVLQQQGLTSPEHADFVRALTAKKQL